MNRNGPLYAACWIAPTVYSGHAGQWLRAGYGWTTSSIAQSQAPIEVGEDGIGAGRSH